MEFFARGKDELVLECPGVLSGEPLMAESRRYAGVHQHRSLIKQRGGVTLPAILNSTSKGTLETTWIYRTHYLLGDLAWPIYTTAPRSDNRAQRHAVMTGHSATQ